MKNKKKLLSIVGSLLIILSLCTSIFAGPPASKSCKDWTKCSIQTDTGCEASRWDESQCYIWCQSGIQISCGTYSGN